MTKDLELCRRLGRQHGFSAVVLLPNRLMVAPQLSIAKMFQWDVHLVSRDHFNAYWEGLLEGQRFLEVLPELFNPEPKQPPIQ